MTTLTLETRTQPDHTARMAVGQTSIEITPCPSEDYWAYRVRLSDTQAIVAFPKFSTIGIGFAVEEDDRNTNLPYWCDTEEIWEHIRHNKGDDAISDADCIEAIRLVQREAVKDRGPQGGPKGAGAVLGASYREALAEFHPTAEIIREASKHPELLAAFRSRHGIDLWLDEIGDVLRGVADDLDAGRALLEGQEA